MTTVIYLLLSWGSEISLHLQGRGKQDKRRQSSEGSPGGKDDAVDKGDPVLEKLLMAERTRLCDVGNKNAGDGQGFLQAFVSYSLAMVNI